jgi:pimeloyl-ACP methyl ester carboxylesterase
MPTDDWRALYPFESHWHALPAWRMHYVDRGPAGRPQGTLLFVHGNPTWSFHWRGLITALEDDYRCVAIDHVGCGLSDKPQRVLHLADHIDHLVSLCDELQLERVTLVAQDWGGAIGLGTLLQRPQRFERLVLFNTGAFPPWYIPWRIAVCRWPVVGRLAVQGGNAFARAALRMTLNRRKRLEGAVEAGCLAPYDSWAHRRQIYEFVADIPMHSSHPTWSTLEEIDRHLPTLAELPSLLVWGMRDWCFRPDCLEKFVGYWPQAEVHRLADVGHWVVEDAPEEAISLVEQFLTRTKALTSPRAAADY